jgi:hypothetical protein
MWHNWKIGIPWRVKLHGALAAANLADNFTEFMPNLTISITSQSKRGKSPRNAIGSFLKGEKY